MPEVLDDIVGPPLPPYTEHAWTAFVALNGTRSFGQMGGNPITFGEILAYQKVRQDRLTRLELECVLAADRAVMKWQAERLRERSDANATKDDETTA